MSTACPWGRNNLTVTADGSVLPCLYSRGFVLGNVFDESLITLYNQPQLCGFRDGTILAEPCRSCELRPSCGGCRARTYYLTGDWFAADPWCPLVARSASAAS
jgi:radical SAM protein with 4Fe4S-binding SPASM domain